MSKTIVKFANNPLWLNRLIDFPMLKNDWVPIILNFPNIYSVKFKAVQVEPEAAVIITKETVIKFSDEPADGSGEEYENPYKEVFDNLSNIVNKIVLDELINSNPNDADGWYNRGVMMEKLVSMQMQSHRMTGQLQLIPIIQKRYRIGNSHSKK